MADFKAIKARVTMQDVLTRYKIELRKLNGTTYKGKCPLPTHTSESDNETFTVNTNIQAWVCHSSSCVAARNTKRREGQGLKKGGDLIEFVKHMAQVASLSAAGELLESWFGPFGAVSEVRAEAPGIPSVEVTETYPEGDINKPLTFVLKDPNPKDPYLQRRGFDEEECEYLGVGFFRGKGMMQDCIVFPIHNEDGALIAYAGRSTDNELAHDKRWKLPPGFRKTHALYNLHRVDGDEVIVVESFWGVLACIRAGVMNAVAIMGTSISDWQAEMLAHRFRRVVLMLDGDEFGRAAVAPAIAKLVEAEVEVIDPALLPKGVQPDDLGPDELRSFLRVPQPFDGELTIIEDELLAAL
jgi:DNA primase